MRSRVERADHKVRRISTNKSFIVKVVNEVSAVIKRNLTPTEVEGVIHHIKSLDFSLLQKDSPDVVTKKIAQQFAGLTQLSRDEIDTHELLKSQIGAIPHTKDSIYNTIGCQPHNVSNRELKSDDIEGFGTRARNTDETNMFYNSNGIAIHSTNVPFTHENARTEFSSAKDKFPGVAKQKVQNVYLLLDSANRNLSTDPSVFKWTVVYSANVTQGTVNTLSDEIHNVVNVQFDRFSLPYVASADNVYKKASILIEELESMSVLLANGGRYHMMFDSEIAGNQIQLTPLINDEGRFRFHTPVNVLNTITIKFRSPFSPIVFLKDRFDVTVTSINPTQSVLTFPEDHGVADGELVHLSRFDTLAPVVDFAQVKEMNREEGHIVTSINNTQLRIDVNLSAATLDPNNLVTCFIASRRLIVPIRMEYLTT